MGFLDRLKTGARLTLRSLLIIRHNRGLMIYPVLLVLACAAVAPILFALFFGALMAGGSVGLISEDNTGIAVAIAGFVVYLVFTFISTFFSTALVHASYTAFSGKTPALGASLKAASRSFGTIFVWSLIAATVGLLIQRLEQRMPWITSLISLAWAALTFFVVPVIALEDTSIKELFKRSGNIFRERWGETAVGVAGAGIIQFAIVLIGGAFVAAVWFLIQIEPLAIALGIITATIAFLVGTTVNGVIKTALYLYARGEHLPDEMQDIDPDQLIDYQHGRPA